MRTVQTSHGPKPPHAPLGLCTPPPPPTTSAAPQALKLGAAPLPHCGGDTSLGVQLGGSQAGQDPGWGAQGGDAAGMLPSPVILAGCPHAGQPLAGLRAVPRGERSLWVRWEAPPTPVAAYVLEWQRVSSEPGRCSACWQMERDGATTAVLIRGKPGAAGGALPSWSAGWGIWHPS